MRQVYTLLKRLTNDNPFLNQLPYALVIGEDPPGVRPGFRAASAPVVSVERTQHAPASLHVASQASDPPHDIEARGQYHRRIRLPVHTIIAQTEPHEANVGAVTLTPDSLPEAALPGNQGHHKQRIHLISLRRLQDQRGETLRALSPVYTRPRQYQGNG